MGKGLKSRKLQVAWTFEKSIRLTGQLGEIWRTNRSDYEERWLLGCDTYSQIEIYVNVSEEITASIIKADEQDKHYY